MNAQNSKSLADAAGFAIGTEPLLWATMCLALVRAAGGREWDALVERVARGEALGRACVSGALDDALATLSAEGGPWLTIASSLSFREALDEVDAREAFDAVSGQSHPDEYLRGLIGRCAEYSCSPEAAEDPCSCVQETLAFVMARLAKALSDAQKAPFASIYLPSSCSPALVSALRDAVPGASVYGQDFSWRNVCMGSMLALLDGASISLALGASIAEDAFEGREEAALAVCILPHERVFGAEMSEGDSRWTYGVPPKGREGYAWLQQSLHHVGEGGFALLCVPTGVLTTTHVKEFPIRRDIIGEGRVYAEITLPGRLFPGSSAVTHLLVLGPKRPAQAGDDCPALFVDAQEMGQRLDGSFERTVSVEVRDKIAEAFEEFLGGGRPREIRFAALAQPADMLDSNCDLTASAYVYTPERLTSNDPEAIGRGLSRLVGELEEAADEVARLDAQLLSLLRGLL